MPQRSRHLALLMWSAVACREGDDAPSGPDTDAPAVLDSDGETDVVSETDRETDAGVHTDTDGPPVESDVPEDSDEDSDTDGVTAPPPWDGGFVAISSAAEAAYPPVSPGSRALSQSPQLVSILVGDLDEDGVPEAVSSFLTRERNITPVIQVWRLDATGAVDVPALAAAIPAQAPSGGVFGLDDLDGDGHLDVLLGDVVSPVRWGDGTGTFVRGLVDVDSPSCAVVTGYTPWDVDADGWTDLLAFCPRGVRLLRRVGPRRFELDDAMLPPTPTLPVEVAAVLSYPSGDQQVHLIIGDATGSPIHPGWLTAPRDASSPLMPVSLTPATVWWTQWPIWYASNILGIASMGAFVDDVDQDGLDDLVLAPGGGQQVVFRGTPTGWVDHSDAAALAFPRYQEGIGAPLPWGTLGLDVDQDGRLDVLSVLGDDATSYRIADGYAHVNCLWRQTSPWVFEEVADGFDFTQPGSWRGLTVSDWDGDGDGDLALGGDGTPPRALRNDIRGGVDGARHHGVSLRLVGTTSNRHGLGARVEVEVDGQPTQHRLVSSPGNPDGWVTPEVFVGVGTAERIAKLRVTWPSGVVQELVDLAVDTRHEVVEPEVLEVVDDDRRLPADGVSSLWVELRPRRPDGTVDVTASVSLRLEGPGTIVGNPGWRGDAWSIRVRADDVPGEARVIATVNGVELGVKPTLFWGD